MQRVICPFFPVAGSLEEAQNLFYSQIWQFVFCVPPLERSFFWWRSLARGPLQRFSAESSAGSRLDSWQGWQQTWLEKVAVKKLPRCGSEVEISIHSSCLSLFLHVFTIGVGGWVWYRMKFFCIMDANQSYGEERLCVKKRYFLLRIQRLCFFDRVDHPFASWVEGAREVWVCVRLLGCSPRALAAFEALT